MFSKEESKQKISELVEKYKSLDISQRKQFNEDDTCRVFIEPLFSYLNWDTFNVDEFKEQRIISGKRVDYAISLHGITQFFIEAKDLTEDLNKKEFIKQAVDYSYNKSVRWSVLTNFEGLKVFIADRQSDLGRSQLTNLRYDQFVEEFDFLWELSKQGISEQILEKRAEKHGFVNVVPVDEDLFEDLLKWRLWLFESIFSYQFDSDPSKRILTDEMVQSILNRLIFIRKAEDKGIEERRLEQLLREAEQAQGKSSNYLEKSLQELFKEFRENYDSELFDEGPEDSLDTIDGPYEKVIKGTYGSTERVGSYNFSDIGVDVLGKVYEQYLGSVAELSKVSSNKPSLFSDIETKTKIISESKKRKDQGIYYTPKPVVDFIVSNTLGHWIKENSGQHNKIYNVSVLDMACGSGSFLTAAFDYLNKYFAQNSRKEESDYFEKRRILEGNIYGVDLDEQAVSISRLNLLLDNLAHREKLPHLENIKQGNSLISGEQKELEKYFGNQASSKKQFNWKERFQPIFKAGGFDVIVGNPPYFNIDTFGHDSTDMKWIKDHYPEIYQDKSDILFYFIARAVSLLKDGGKLGFIVSRSFLEADKASKLRNYLLENCKIEQVVDFRDFQVFEGVGIATSILIVSKENDDKSKSQHKVSVTQVKSWNEGTQRLLEYIRSTNEKTPYSDEKIEKFNYDQSNLSHKSWNFASNEVEAVKKKIDNSNPRLSSLYLVGKGMETAADKIFGKLTSQKIKSLGLETKYLRERVVNSKITRYLLEPSGEFVIYIEDFDNFESLPPKIKIYLKENEKELKERATVSYEGRTWFKFSRPMHKDYYIRPKIVCPRRGSHNSFALDKEGKYMTFTDTTVIFPKERSPYDLRYILALLNSKVLDFRYKNLSKITAKDSYEYFPGPVGELPLKELNLKNKEDREIYEKIINLVDEIMELYKSASKTTKLEDEYYSLPKKIKEKEMEIDSIVSKLYGLNDEDIKVIESTV